MVELMKDPASVLIMVVMVIALGCQPGSPAAPARQAGPIPTKIAVTATPDIGATVTALVNQGSGGPQPEPTAPATPNIEATVEARLAATLEAMSIDALDPTEMIPSGVPVATIPTASAVSLPLLKYDKDLLLFGPTIGRVRPQDWDGRLKVFPGPDVRQDVLVEATFQVPETAVGKHWQHGLLLKYDGGNNHHLVSIDSMGSWSYFHRLGDSRKLGEKAQHSPDISLEPGTSNLLQVAMVGDEARVYINGKYQGNVSLSEDTVGSQVALFLSDEAEGRNSFVGFSVWKLLCGLLGLEVGARGFVDNRLRFDQLVQVINQEEQLLDLPYPAPRVEKGKRRTSPKLDKLQHPPRGIQVRQYPPKPLPSCPWKRRPWWPEPWKPPWGKVWT